MKKIFSMMLVLSMFFLISCGQQQNTPTSNTDPSTSGANTTTESNWPTQPITVLEPYAAGSTSDLSMRLICSYMEKELGQPMVVKNVVGADGATCYTECGNAPQWVSGKSQFGPSPQMVPNMLTIAMFICATIIFVTELRNLLKQKKLANTAEKKDAVDKSTEETGDDDYFEQILKASKVDIVTIGTIISRSPSATHLAVSMALPPPKPTVQLQPFSCASAFNFAISCRLHSP